MRRFIRRLIVFFDPPHPDWRWSDWHCRMRRHVGGSWQYREETYEEAFDRFSRDAW
jgi:hypothetical protein